MDQVIILYIQVQVSIEVEIMQKFGSLLIFEEVLLVLKGCERRHDDTAFLRLLFDMDVGLLVVLDSQVNVIV